MCNDGIPTAILGKLMNKLKKKKTIGKKKKNPDSEKKCLSYKV